MSKPTMVDAATKPIRRTFSRLLSTITQQQAAKDQKLKQLLEGLVIANRYQIQAFIAQGAHGQVYQALDLELDQVIALKLLHPSLLGKQQMVERFKQELLIARQVTHNNVCRVFDVCKAVVSIDNEPVEVMFITMELIAGRTLADYLGRHKKPFNQDQAISIIRQVIAGLNEAHRHQFIHGDIKASNIILEKQAIGGWRAVITDFGISRSSQVKDKAANSAKMEGTPLYMAPEQVSGEALSTATDIFSLGVLIYRMLTGQWPFLEQTALLTALKRLHASPLDNALLINVAGKDTAKAILKCLECEPQQRFQTLLPLDEILAKQTTGKPRNTRLRYAIAITVVMVATGAWYLYKPSSAVNNTVQLRPVVAMLPLSNQTGKAEFDWLGASTGQSMINHLRQVDELRSVPAETISQLLLQAPKNDENGQLWVAQRSAADWFVSGGYQLDGEQNIHWSIQLLDAGNGKSVFATELTTDESLFNQVGIKIVTALLQHLQVPSQQSIDLNNSQAMSLVALSNYSQGLELLHQFKPDQAIEYFLRALKLEPDQPLIEAALAEAQLKLGNVSRALGMLKRAQAHAENLSQRERLNISAKLNLAENNHQRAIEIYRALREFFPDELGFGLSLARALASDNQLSAAFATLTELRSLPDELGEDVQIDLLEAELGAIYSEFEIARKAGIAALSKGQSNDMPLVVADAKRWLARVWYYADSQTQDAIEALQSARQTYAALGINRSVADVALELADLARNQADEQLSAQLYDEALQASEATGDNELRARIMNGQGNLLSGKGRYAEALAVYQSLLAEYENANNAHMLGLMHHNVGTTAVKLGQLDLGWTHLSESKNIYQQSNDRFGLMLVNYAMGSFWKVKGELQPALISFKQAVTLAESVDSETWATYARLEIGDIARRQGDYVTAVSSATKAFDTFLQRGEEVRAARVGLSLAGFLIYAEDYKTAGEVAEQSRRLIEKHQIKQSIGQVHSVLAQVSAHFGEYDEVEKHLQKATQSMLLMEQVEHRLLLQNSLAITGYDAGVYDRAYVKEQLEQIQQTAKSDGLMLPLLRSKFNLAKLSRDAGHLRQSQEMLQTIESQAQVLGYKRLADKAQTLLETVSSDN